MLPSPPHSPQQQTLMTPPRDRRCPLLRVVQTAKSSEPKPRSRSRSASVSAAAAAANGTAATAAKANDGAPASDDKTKTPSKGRGKRPRVSDVAEEGEDGEEVPTAAATPARARRGKTPTGAAAETPAKQQSARTKRETTPKAPNAKKPRLSELPKPIKVGMNPLPKPMPLVNNMPAYKLEPPYTLPKDVDPSKEGNAPLSVFVCGTGDFGQLGLGVDVLSEVPRPRLHKWFEENSRLSEAKADGDDKKEEEGADNKASSVPVLGKYGIEDLASGGMHSLAVDSEGKVRVSQAARQSVGSG